MGKHAFEALKVPLIWFLCWLGVWFYVYHETLESVALVWLNSNTYMHCFFVIPIALFFFNERKQFVFASEPKPSFAMVIPLIGLQGLWLLGFAADVGLFMHAAVFGMLSCVFVMFLGFGIAKILWFPLGFIVFSIPIGEELVPYFQVITADLSVQFLLWSGVPVYRDGMFITVPGGYFEVAEACSGVRFFVACVVMGAVISYVSYNSIWKRTLFFLLSILAPILANGVRAYGTIMVGNFAGVEYAKGADHLVYGWGFFAFIVMVLVVMSRIGSEQPLQFHLAQDQREFHVGWSATNWIPIAILAVLPLFVTEFAYQKPDYLVALEQLSYDVDYRAEQLDVMESLLANRQLQNDVYLAGRPIKWGWMSSRFGRRNDPFTGRLAWHKGVDFAGKEGSDIVSVGSGVVTWSGDRYGYGLMVEISHGGGVVTRYAHAKEVLVKLGDIVKKGHTVALMGSTGRSTGPHVHFEVRKNGKALDPVRYVNRRSKG